MVNELDGRVRLTDLTKTKLGQVQNQYFRTFVPVKTERLRLPTSLPEFHSLRHVAMLSDSPVTAAHRLGGHWTDYNLAAITQVAACNFRCTYCYVEYKHLAGQDSFATTAEDVVDSFCRLRAELRTRNTRLAILRVSGGEPLLVPSLLVDVYRELDRRRLSGECLVKVESNLSALPYGVSQMSQAYRDALRATAQDITLHATIHSLPSDADWPGIRAGLDLALRLGFDIYPAIGGANWTDQDMGTLFDHLHEIHPRLPLRLAVRPFNLSYDAPAHRRNLPKNSNPAPTVAWEDILRSRLDTCYLAQPRHAVILTR
jgi:hypothetical protein